MAKQNVKKVVSKTTTKKVVVTTTSKAPSSDLKPGERRMPSEYLPFKYQLRGSNPADIIPMEPADTSTYSRPGYRVDMSRSKKVMTSPSTSIDQPTYIKLAPNSSGKKTTTVKKPVKTTTPKKVEMDASARLPIKKAKTIENNKNSEIVKGPKPTLKVPVEVKYKKEVKVKAQSKGGKPGQRLVTNAKAAAKNIVGPSKFKREEKLAGGYERVGKAAITRGQSTKQNIKDIKEYKKYVKSAEGKKQIGKTEAKSRVKDLNLSKRYLKREDKGRNKYFNQSALNQTTEMTQAELKKSKGKTQAGRTRYSS